MLHTLATFICLCVYSQTLSRCLLLYLSGLTLSLTHKASRLLRVHPCRIMSFLEIGISLSHFGCLALPLLSRITDQRCSSIAKERRQKRLSPGEKTAFPRLMDLLLKKRRAGFSIPDTNVGANIADRTKKKGPALRCLRVVIC